jgi:hypothetical protein
LRRQIVLLAIAAALSIGGFIQILGMANRVGPSGWFWSER